jgi:ABC-2 type transport system ATP-binding protein
MVQPQITVENLSKTYRVPVRSGGLGAALKSLARRTYSNVEPSARSASRSPGGDGRFHRPQRRRENHHPQDALRAAAPHRRRGPGGGLPAWQREADFLRRISMVLGNKSQMLWDIPPLDTFRVLAEIYSIPQQTFQRTLDELVALLEMEDLLTKRCATSRWASG